MNIFVEMFNEKLKVMKMYKRTIGKYYDVFINLKRDSENGIPLTTTYTRTKYKVGSEFCSVLRDLKIIIKKDGKPTWNENIKPSTRLANKVAIETNAKIKGFNTVINLDDSKILSKKPAAKRVYNKRKVVLPKVDKSKIESFSKKTEKQQRVFSIAWGLITIKY